MVLGLVRVLVVRGNLIKKVNKGGRYIWFIFLLYVSPRAWFSNFLHTFLYNHLNWGDSVISQPFPQLFIVAHTIHWKEIESTVIHFWLWNYLTEHPFIHYPFCIFVKCKQVDDLSKMYKLKMLDKNIICEIHKCRKLGYSFFQSFGIWLKIFSYQFFFKGILPRQDIIKKKKLYMTWKRSGGGGRTPHNNHISL